MTDIDWLAVDMVCSGASMALHPDERRAALRRMAARMIVNGDSMYDYSGLLSAEEVGRRIRMDVRSVQRIRSGLPPATETTCPVCRERVWVAGNVVEPHPDRLLEDCPMGGRAMPAPVRGLAALRPDLFRWLPQLGVEV